MKEKYINIPDKLPEQKYFVSGGCSFTTSMVYDSWPEATCELMSFVNLNTAFSGIGNNLILMNVLNTVQRLIKHDVPSEDIVVGVMWSGADRTEFYRNQWQEDIQPMKKQGFMTPIRFIEESDGYWVPLTPVAVGFINEMAGRFFPSYTKRYAELGQIMYDEFFFSDTTRVINTLRSVLTLQEFLKNHKIKYFFTRYVKNAFIEKCWDDPEVSWLVDLIDWDMFIEGGEFEWCFDNTDLPFQKEVRFSHEGDMTIDARNVHGRDPNIVAHPTTLQHAIYAEQVIVPRLKTIL